MRNIPGLTDEQRLGEFEDARSALRLAQIRLGEAPEATRGNFDLEHLKAIHQHTFQDVYEWAGKTRAEEMQIEGQTFKSAPMLYKVDGYRSPPFVPAPMVESDLKRTFQQLQERDHLRGLSREEFANQAADTFARINNAHPFMEGNGRTQREFMTQLAEQAGHELNFDVVSQERMTIVSVESRMEDNGGMRRLFQEISDPDRVALLEKAQDYLSREKVDWDRAYIATATPGREYQGQVGLHSSELVIIRDQGDMLVGQTRDVPPETLRAGAVVQFTASGYPKGGAAPQVQRGMDYE
ncbi:Fic/DOC family protein [Deinococcus hopiensis]|uniref:Fic/DOC family protein n=1 Tax=Deinococcus hopiensis TaxID=309885 RepID=UPI002481AB08|nr:Fic family protein [Deinococcus hopiensis]